MYNINNDTGPPRPISRTVDLLSGKNLNRIHRGQFVERVDCGIIYLCPKLGKYFKWIIYIYIYKYSISNIWCLINNFPKDCMKRDHSSILPWNLKRFSHGIDTGRYRAKEYAKEETLIASKTISWFLDLYFKFRVLRRYCKKVSPCLLIWQQPSWWLASNNCFLGCSIPFGTWTEGNVNLGQIFIAKSCQYGLMNFPEGCQHSQTSSNKCFTGLTI